MTHYFLRVSAFTMVLSPLCLLTYDIVALGIAVRVAYRNCTAEHGRKVAASFGGMLSLVSRISGAVVVLAARPVYMFSLSTLA